MRPLFCTVIFILVVTVANAQPLSFEFTATLERTVTVGKAAPAEYAKSMNPKVISFKDNVLKITIASTGKEYSKDNVLRVIDFKKNNSITYALEVKDKAGLYYYYRYTINKTLSGDESKSLSTPFIVDGQFIMEVIYFE